MYNVRNVCALLKRSDVHQDHNLDLLSSGWLVDCRIFILLDWHVQHRLLIGLVMITWGSMRRQRVQKVDMQFVDMWWINSGGMRSIEATLGT